MMVDPRPLKPRPPCALDMPRIAPPARPGLFRVGGALFFGRCGTGCLGAMRLLRSPGRRFAEACLGAAKGSRKDFAAVNVLRYHPMPPGRYAPGPPAGLL